MGHSNRHNTPALTPSKVLHPSATCCSVHTQAQLNFLSAALQAATTPLLSLATPPLVILGLWPQVTQPLRWDRNHNLPRLLHVQVLGRAASEGKGVCCSASCQPLLHFSSHRTQAVAAAAAAPAGAGTLCGGTLLKLQPIRAPSQHLAALLSHPGTLTRVLLACQVQAADTAAAVLLLLLLPPLLTGQGCR
jgi:hypothetical protein